MGNDISQYKPIRRGVRQGFVFPSDLFNLYSEIILRNIGNHEGIGVGDQKIKNLRYADYTVVIADSEENLQTILTTVTEESEKLGQQLNVKKTECIVISRKTVIPKCNIACKGDKIKQVNTFKYLGCTLTPDCKGDTEIKKRIGQSKTTFSNMKCIFTNNRISLTIKIRVMRAYVLSVLSYGCECWTLTKYTEKRLEAVEM